MAESGSLPLAMRPQGFAGRAFGVVMEWMNGRAYQRALVALVPVAGEHVLEIGFGTGRFAELLLAAAPGVRVCGVDPAETMVRVANRRRGVAAAGARADLRLGDDANLAWPDGSFDGVVALHSFQFWPEPECSLREIRRVLAPSGRLVLVLRDHSRDAPDWLPNPVSRSGDEAGGLSRLLGECGFDVDVAGERGDVIVARRAPCVPNGGGDR